VKPTTERIVGVNNLIAALDLSGLYVIATYLRHAGHDLLITIRPQELRILPALVATGTGAIQSEFGGGSIA
jgi:hypothetical protein